MTMPSHEITNEAQLRAVIGEPMEFVRAKVGSSLNEAMREFVSTAPLAFVSTIDVAGNPDVSPKGDPAGFIEVLDDTTLLIPERPGNRLTFGFNNILRNGRIGLIFVVPNQLETFRVKGTATLHNDPETLARMDVSGKPALLYTRVQVEECFFHCGKALVRSHMWQPDKWQAGKRSIAAKQMAPGVVISEERTKQTEEVLAKSYRDELY